jgi:hypothetical protein
MKKMFRNALPIFLMAAVIFSFSCSRESGLLGITDETEKARELVDSANKDLKAIKEIYKVNEGAVEDLKLAMKERKIEEVKKIADEGVYAINKGMGLGKKAIDKIERAKRLKINKNFRDYLDLKEKSLRKFMEAFEIRRQLAITLRNGYDPENEKQRDLITSEFKEKDEKFKEIMDEAGEASAKANELFKQATQKQND